MYGVQYVGPGILCTERAKYVCNVMETYYVVLSELILLLLWVKVCLMLSYVLHLLCQKYFLLTRTVFKIT